MTTVASKVPFMELAGLLERISTTQGSDKKKQRLREFIDKWRDFHSKMHKDDPNTTDSFYPVMRLLLPQLERERVAYGIKEHTLAKLYIEVLGLGKESPAANMLLHYKAPKNAKGDAGDFASVAFTVLKNRCPEKGTLFIGDVNQHLDEIAANNAVKTKDVVKKNLQTLLRSMSATEQKWLIRMIMKELKVGVSQQSVFGLFHVDAESLFNVTNSLEKVCTMLRDPTVRMHEIEVALFSPFRPMLGERGSPNDVEKLMNDKPFYIETKFDGERMQLHKKGDAYKFFSRGGNEYTHTYGSNVYEGNLVPHIHGCFKPDVQSCILDGEMVGFNPADNTIRSKGENFDIKSDNTEGYQPCFCAFDILLLNDKVLTNKPLSERLPLIKEVVTPQEGRFMISDIKEGRTRQDCVNALNEAIDNREEGIMVKQPDSVYKPNTRKGGWFKIKPEYVGGLMDELDVLVIGGYFGVGHRGGMMSHFLCGLALSSQSGDKPAVFHSFCRVGSGYSRKELYDFNQKLADHWKPFDKRRPPSSIVLAPGLKQKPDAWIEPENSCIVQIKAAEIIQSDQFKTSYTLRFPRVEKIRTDKNWYECMTVSELEEIRQKSEGKLAGRYAEVDDSEGAPVKKKRRMAARQERPTVAAQFRATDVSSVTKVSEMFMEREFCVVNGPTSHSKSVLEKKIVEYGGTIVQHPGQSTFCVIAEKVAIKVKNLISKGIYDVVKAEWLIKCIEEKRFIKWEPSDMIHTSPATQAKFSEDYDRHGDSYITDTDVEQLKTVFSKIEEEGHAVKVTARDMAEIENKYFPDESPYGLFRLCRIYLDNKLVIGDSSTQIKDSTLDLTALELRFFGATITDSLDDTVSHVMVDSGDLCRVAQFRKENQRREKKFHIVTEKWMKDCLEECDLKNERYYEPVAV